jgi:hypothetical protein
MYPEYIETHHVFAPVFASKIWAARLQPVARYFPSAENLTQHTTLLPRDANVSEIERYGENRFFIPLVMECVYKVDVERTFDLGIKNGEPITTFFLELRRDTKWVELIQEAAVLAYRSERTRIVSCGAGWRRRLIGGHRRWRSSRTRYATCTSERCRG